MFRVVVLFLPPLVVILLPRIKDKNFATEDGLFNNTNPCWREGNGEKNKGQKETKHCLELQ